MSTSSVHAFSEKVALITDGSNPFGRAVALQLALLGAYVIVGRRSGADADASSLDELTSLGTLAKSVECDLLTATGAENLVSVVNETFGRLDLLVNCLKSDAQSAFLKNGDENFETRFLNDLKATYFATSAAIVLMQDRPKPSIVNYAFEGSNPASVAIEFGIAGMTAAFARELSSKFRVNGIRIAKSENDEPKGELLLRSDGAVSPDDAARVAVYLLSSEAKSVNGQMIDAA
ncbi:MAG: SDR family oxidoreductase [Pyrinomonadaceae bacterium]|nr:SDR family oxidoreductase [Pyrinomonadaceae bacterium]